MLCEVSYKNGLLSLTTCLDYYFVCEVQYSCTTSSQHVKVQCRFKSSFHFLFYNLFNKKICIRSCCKYFHILFPLGSLILTHVTDSLAFSKMNSSILTNLISNFSMALCRHFLSFPPFPYEKRFGVFWCISI